MKSWLALVVLSFLLLCLFYGNCYSQESKRSESMQIIKIKVSASGQIVVDDKTATLDELKERLDQVKGKEAAIWYYRETGNSEPSSKTWDIIRKVLDLIAEYKMPISLSSKPDFSDYIDEKGQSHPRDGLNMNKS